MKQQTNQVNEISVIYKPTSVKSSPIKTSLDAYKIFFDLYPVDTIALQERSMALYLNRANKVLGIYPMSIGGITGTVVDPRLLFSVALKVASVNVILAHNHPSGSLKPSKADIDITQRCREAGKLLDINLIDHIILTPDEGSYYSFADDGILII
jgi:DNA repair protein RadC